jgi:hypothetical protein
MSQTTQATQAAESGIALAAKATPPVSVSLATIAGMPVSDLVLWCTLLYTLLLIGHKLMSIWRDLTHKGNSRGRS